MQFFFVGVTVRS